MLFHCECKLYFYSETIKNSMSNHQERRKNQKSMSLPSITETKNATLLQIVTSAVHYTATSPHFCNSRPDAGGRHPQLTARPTAPDLFQGSGVTAPEFYKLSNFNYGSSTTYSIDDEPQILLFYSCRQPQHYHQLQLLHHGVPGVDGCHPQKNAKPLATAVGGCQRHRPPTRCPLLLTGSTLCYHRLGAD